MIVVVAIRQGVKTVVKREPKPDFAKPGQENSNRFQASAKDAEEVKRQLAQYLNQHQTYMLLALKAQNQCRQTLAALAEIKNPRRTTFVGQQNTEI
ncbi:MAG: hypothetical protein ACREX9_12750 [Gammaproteobacteria bacterium]